MQDRPQHTLDDAALMGALNSGDKAAFEELARRFEKRLYYFAYRHIRERELSLDLVQETLLRVYRHRKDWRKGSKLSTWIFAILLNLCRDYGRKSGRFSSMEIPEVARAAEHSSFRPQELSPLQHAEKNQLAELLAAAIAALPPKQAELIKLKTGQDLSFEEAGQALGIKATAARATASRAYKKLKVWLQRHAKDRD